MVKHIQIHKYDTFATHNQTVFHSLKVILKKDSEFKEKYVKTKIIFRNIFLDDKKWMTNNLMMYTICVGEQMSLLGFFF